MNKNKSSCVICLGLTFTRKALTEHFKVRDVKTLEMQCKSYDKIDITGKKCTNSAIYFRVLEPKFRFNFLISFSPLVSKH